MQTKNNLQTLETANVTKEINLQKTQVSALKRALQTISKTIKAPFDTSKGYTVLPSNRPL
jgi:hypothetical protein